jgi:hypothetical protein
MRRQVLGVLAWMLAAAPLPDTLAAKAKNRRIEVLLRFRE